MVGMCLNSHSVKMTGQNKQGKNTDGETHRSAVLLSFYSSSY